MHERNRNGTAFTFIFYFLKPECSENDDDSLFNAIKHGVHFSDDNNDFRNDSSLEILEYDTSISEKVCHKNAGKYIKTASCSSRPCLFSFGNSRPKIEHKTDVKIDHCKVTFA